MIYVIIAFIIGFYFGNSSQRREDADKVKKLIFDIKPNKYKVLKRNEPQNDPKTNE
jgi:hypothetical protein